MSVFPSVEMTGHTLRARVRGASRRSCGSQPKSSSSDSGSPCNPSPCKRTASSVATMCSHTPLPPHPQTPRSACGPVPLDHSTVTLMGTGRPTVASIRLSSTARNVTRPVSASARAVRVRSRANQLPIDAGNRARHVANGFIRQRMARNGSDCLGLGRRDCRRLERRNFRELELFRIVGIELGQNMVAGSEQSAQHLLCELVLDLALNRAPQRTRPELRIPAFLGEQFLAVFGDLEVHVLRLDLADDFLELETDDLFDLLAGELVEHDDLVDAVEELRTEGVLDLLHHLVLHLLVLRVFADAEILLRPEADVGGGR